MGDSLAQRRFARSSLHLRRDWLVLAAVGLYGYGYSVTKGRMRSSPHWLLVAKPGRGEACVKAGNDACRNGWSPVLSCLV